LVIEKSLIEAGIFVSGASIPKLICACKSIERSLEPSPIEAVIGLSNTGCSYTNLTKSLFYLGLHLYTITVSVRANISAKVVCISLSLKISPKSYPFIIKH
jgi:hypothetical protein